MSDEQERQDAYWAVVDVVNYERWVGDAEHAAHGAEAGVDAAKARLEAAKDAARQAEQDLADVKAKQKAAKDKVAALPEDLQVQAMAEVSLRVHNRTVYVEAGLAEGTGS